MGCGVGDAVFPGDKFEGFEKARGVTILGPGLRQGDNLTQIEITQPGRLRHKAPNTYWVENNKTRYIPKKNELVVGTIVKKLGDILRVDIGSAELATLSLFSFEGATKKQKPDVQVGDLVYARVLNAYKDMEPELICVDSYFKAGNLGVLPNKGLMVNLSAKLTQRLLAVQNNLLETLAKKYPFEVCIGINCKVWVHSAKTRDVLNIVKALKAMENQSDDAVTALCNKY